jgi:hypothetical protein
VRGVRPEGAAGLLSGGRGGSPGAVLGITVVAGISRTDAGAPGRVYRQRRKPPSASIVWPVTERASGPVSQATTAAASAAVFQRPRGMARATTSLRAGSAQPVSVGPGLTHPMRSVG